MKTYSSTTARYRLRPDVMVTAVLMATAVIPIGRVSCGHQAIHWGTGMLVNDGAQTPEFGDAWSASLVERCVFGKSRNRFQAYRTSRCSLLVTWSGEMRMPSCWMVIELLARLWVGAIKQTLTRGQFFSYRHQNDRDDPLFSLINKRRPVF